MDRESFVSLRKQQVLLEKQTVTERREKKKRVAKKSSLFEPDTQRRAEIVRLGGGYIRRFPFMAFILYLFTRTLMISYYFSSTF